MPLTDMPFRTSFTLLLLSFLSACASFSLEADSTTKTASSPEINPAGWWRTAVFYEIFVRSFYDTDKDGIGDLNGITAKLDYLNSLGIDAIWLMPIHPSPSYHGYDVTDYYAINPEYGTMDDFKNLLNEAHRRDIRIIIDFVINHTSSRHPWFMDANTNPKSAYRDYYIWADEPGPGNWHQGQNGYYYGYFWEGMPDLNYSNHAVTEEMLKVTDYWLNEISVDGFRVDAVKHLIEENGKVENAPATHLWLEDFHFAYKAQNPQAYTVGEVFGAGASVVALYTGDELDHIFNFEMASGFVNSANGEASSGIASAYKFAFMDMPDFNFATFLANHDQNRVMSVFNGNANKAKVASFLMLTAPGTPYIYYGEEIGMQGVKPDEDIRLPMQWSGDKFAGFSSVQPWRNLSSDYTQVNVKAQEDDPASLLNHYRTLIQLRKEHPALLTGNATLIETENPVVFALLRESGLENILIVVNLGKTHVTDYRLDLSATAITLDGNNPAVLFGGSDAIAVNTLDGYKPLAELPPYQMLILKVGGR